MILLDTNILGRMADVRDPLRITTEAAIERLLSGTEALVIVPQNLYEFWAVGTRQSGSPPIGQNGLGMSVEEASGWLLFFQKAFTLLPDTEDLLPRWHALVRRLAITGRRSHDARLVAAMQVHGITQLLTFNPDHFSGYPITVVDPASV